MATVVVCLDVTNGYSRCLDRTPSLPSESYPFLKCDTMESMKDNGVMECLAIALMLLLLCVVCMIISFVIVSLDTGVSNEVQTLFSIYPV